MAFFFVLRVLTKYKPWVIVRINYTVSLFFKRNISDDVLILNIIRKLGFQFLKIKFAPPSQFLKLFDFETGQTQTASQTEKN